MVIRLRSCTAKPPAAPSIRVWRLIAIAAVWGLMTLCTTSCKRAEPVPKGNGRLQVVVTHSILSDIVGNVGDDRLEVVTLVGPNGYVHTYEPTPADTRAVSSASVIMENGLAFEPWIDKLYKSSGSKAVRVVASQGFRPRTLMEGGREETDPHCWQDVHGAMQMTHNVADALAKADPAGASAYRANAQAYLTKLDVLDRYIVQKVQTLPPDRRILVTSHDSLGYFAERYGFKVLGSALGSLTTEGGDPSAQKIAAVVEEVRQSKVPTIFTENMQSPKLMEQIGKEAGVRVDTSLYTDALGPRGNPGETYLGMMRYNVDTIVSLLKP